MIQMMELWGMMIYILGMCQKEILTKSPRLVAWYVAVKSKNICMQGHRVCNSMHSSVQRHVFIAYLPVIVYNLNAEDLFLTTEILQCAEKERKFPWLNLDSLKFAAIYLHLSWINTDIEVC